MKTKINNKKTWLWCRGFKKYFVNRWVKNMKRYFEYKKYFFKT